MRIFFYLIFFLFFSKISFSENMPPLKKYLNNNKDYKDTVRAIYLLKRCTSLHYFLSNNKFTKKDNNIRIRYEKDYNFFSSKLYTTLNLRNSDFSKLSKKVDDEILKFSNIYIKDSQKNLLKTGSSFKKSYIIDDLKICSKIR